MEWLLAVVCCLMCFGFLIEAQTKIHVQDPIMMALAEETLLLRFRVIVPVNQSSDTFICHHDASKRVLYTQSFSQSQNVSWELTVYNSSYSGEYHCDYKQERAYWAVLVREVGYIRDAQEMDNAVVIPIVVLSVGLFLFASIGSTILLKDYMKQHKVRDERMEEREEEEEEEAEGMNEVGDEGATDSVYTALEHGTSSIYNVLKQSDDTDQKCVEQQVMDETCVKQNLQKEDGIFESVYENL